MRPNKPFRRRSFLKGIGLAVPIFAGQPGLVLAQTQAGSPPPDKAAKASARELVADLVILAAGWVVAPPRWQPREMVCG